jgi:hypothetical protein
LEFLAIDVVGLLEDSSCKGCISSKKELALLNIYGPCKDRKLFWSSVENNGILSTLNLIIAGDLNFILSSEENWGGSFVPGSNEVFFRDLLTSLAHRSRWSTFYCQKD